MNKIWSFRKIFLLGLAGLVIATSYIPLIGAAEPSGTMTVIRPSSRVKAEPTLEERAAATRASVDREASRGSVGNQDPRPGIRENRAVSDAETTSRSARDPGKPAENIVIARWDPSRDVTQCIYKNDPRVLGGILTIEFNIDRYVGPVDSEGKLLDDPRGLEYPAVSETATIEIMAYDVNDTDLDGGTPPPEIDAVFLNGKRTGHLKGMPGKWLRTVIQTDICNLRFPDKGSLPTPETPEGKRPTPRLNRLEIAIDTKTECTPWCSWCTDVDWVRVSFGVAPPVLLVHGIATDPETCWEKPPRPIPGSQRVIDVLDQKKIPYSHRITLDWKGGRDKNSRHLGGVPGVFDPTGSAGLKKQAAAFGANSATVFAHSKGGLDTRSYLDGYWYSEDQKNGFQVKALYTYDSPHKGTVLASISNARGTSNYHWVDNQRDGRLLAFVTTDALLDIGRLFGDSGHVRIIPMGTARADLTVQSCEMYNALFRKQTDRKKTGYYRLGTVSGDADDDCDGEISDEESESFPAGWMVGELLYRVLNRSVDITANETLCSQPPHPWCKWDLNDIAPPKQGNTLLVTRDSADLDEMAEEQITPTPAPPTWYENHFTIKNEEVTDAILWDWKWNVGVTP